MKGRLHQVICCLTLGCMKKQIRSKLIKDEGSLGFHIAYFLMILNSLGFSFSFWILIK